MSPQPELTLDAFREAAAAFSRLESLHHEPSLYGVDNGKRVGTYLEHKLRAYLQDRYDFPEGNSASGVDFPSINVDLKTTSIEQPQSSCPFRSARQKIRGLGYHLLVMVYDKSDDPQRRTANLNIGVTLFIESRQTADFQTTYGLIEILKNHGNQEDLVAFMMDRNLPVDLIEANRLADELLADPPVQGFLTISNALQWRLQYGHAISIAGEAPGVDRLK